MSIRTENGWHLDENNNRWDADYHTAEQADVLSKTLIDCSYCVNCSDCHSCIGCLNCSDCHSCSDCVECSDSHSCNSCYFCRHCTGCNDCSYCIFCSSCGDCSDCYFCHFFSENPQRIYCGKIGSSGDIMEVYWLEPGKEQCVVGRVNRGTLDQLEAHVKETHANNHEHLDNYLRFIEKVRKYQQED